MMGDTIFYDAQGLKQQLCLNSNKKIQSKIALITYKNEEDPIKIEGPKSCHNISPIIRL